MSETTSTSAPIFRGERRIEFAERCYRDPGEGELLIAPRANAVCGSDRGFYLEGAGHIPGHETAGVVVKAGPGTTTAAGTRGVVFLMDYCGTCRSCRMGATNQCLAKRADMGIADDGGYGPLEIVHESIFFPVTDDTDYATATMLLDVMGTSGHAIGRARLVRPDIESVYIAGAGPIGLGLVVMSHLVLGESIPVFVSDVSGWRREFAATLGATPIDAADPASIASIGRVDAAFDSSGKQAARQTAVSLLSQRGVLVCVGHGEGVRLDVSSDLIAPERAVLGSEYFRFDELPGNLDLLRANKEYVSKVITHRFPVSRIDEAFETFFSGESGKVIVEQGEE